MLIRGFVTRISPLFLDPIPKIDAYPMLAHFNAEIFKGGFNIFFFFFYSSSHAWAGHYPLTLTFFGSFVLCYFFFTVSSIGGRKIFFGDFMQSSYAICLLITILWTFSPCSFFPFSWTAWRAGLKSETEYPPVVDFGGYE
ncbi:uncharacterized protein TrAFT101_008554 [Trichoderma asperellum]|uniref:uncharacterized protein n=1 Tax=Trichoderma asperellum TaxID=101201 RepID=UPI0033267613|nr:hypothetical protein TrAFT101_008554 [Trichoderma asperellum]